jgi:hypothetical protein
MPREYDRNKRNKSWREIDRGKDRSAHRKEDRPRVPPNQQARSESASKVYRSKLDAFFDGDGKPPEQIREKLGQLEAKAPAPGGRERIAALKAIKDAGTSSAVTKAVRAYLDKWELPPDHDVLVQVLTASDDDYVAAALELIGELLGANRPPRRTTLLEQRLKRIVSLGEEPELQDRAKAILKQLRLFS